MDDDVAIHSRALSLSCPHTGPEHSGLGAESALPRPRSFKTVRHDRRAWKLISVHSDAFATRHPTKASAGDSDDKRINVPLAGVGLQCKALVLF